MLEYMDLNFYFEPEATLIVEQKLYNRLLFYKVLDKKFH